MRKFLIVATLFASLAAVPAAAAVAGPSIADADVNGLCVYYRVGGGYVNTPGQGVHVPPVHVIVDPTSTYVRVVASGYNCILQDAAEDVLRNIST